MKKTVVFVPLVVVVFLTATTSAHAQSGKGARELVNLLTRKFAKDMAKESTEALTRRLTIAASKHGDDVLIGIEKVGPRGLKLIEEAGEHAPAAAKLMARHADTGMAIAGKPQSLQLITRYGDDALEACCKHPGAAESVITKCGEGGAKALVKLGAKEGRRLSMLTDAGELTKMAHGREGDFLSIVAKYGDKGLNYIWDNKAKFATAAVAIAFISDPEPFINGTKELGIATVEAVVKPIATSTGKAVENTATALAPEIGRNTNWTLLGISSVGILALLIAWRTWLRRRPPQAIISLPHPNPTTGVPS